MLVDESLPEREGLEPVAPDAAFDHERRGADIVDQGQAVGLQELPSHKLSDTLIQDRLEGVVVEDRHRQLQPPRGPRLDGRAELVPPASHNQGTKGEYEALRRADPPSPTTMFTSLFPTYTPVSIASP